MWFAIWRGFSCLLLLYALMFHVNTMAKDSQNFFRHLKTNGLGSKPVVYLIKYYVMHSLISFIVKDNYACLYLGFVHTRRMFFLM